jgi:hypothetical protein
MFLKVIGIVIFVLDSLVLRMSCLWLLSLQEGREISLEEIIREIRVEGIIRVGFRKEIRVGVLFR